MRLLFYSVLRHMRRHALQTALTVMITVFITSALSFLFYFASGFQSLLREYALAQNGTYHYQYFAEADSDSGEMLCEMAEAFRKDSWFSGVELKEEGAQICLRLTVAEPGLFTSKRMKQKFAAFQTDFREGRDMELQIASDHNFELLASCGDLSRDNGMYSYLLVFFVLFGILALTSVLMLGAVLQVSALQREREFALLWSVGADSRQIGSMVLMECSVCLFAAAPLGILGGIGFFEISKGRVDALLHGLADFAPIRLVVSVPFSAALVICEAAIVLASGFRCAGRAALGPMEVLCGRRELRVLGRERGGGLAGQKHCSPERWLAKKAHGRFRRRSRSIRVVQALTVALCLVMTGFRSFAAEAVEHEFGYNFCVDLYGDDKEVLEAAVGVLSEECGLCAVREARFELQSPYPLSELGIASGFAERSGMLPDVLLVGVDEESWKNLCGAYGTEEKAAGDLQGIFVDVERTWRQNGVTYQGNPFALEAGERLMVYPDSGEQGEGFSITIAGVTEETPLYVDTEAASRLVLLVPEAAFWYLEPLRPFAEEEPGLYHISLRGLLEDADLAEQRARSFLDGCEGVTGQISNYEEERQEEQAGISAFSYLSAALAAVLALVCLCCCYTVSWTEGRMRRKEYGIYLSIGMEPKTLRKMIGWELLYRLADSFWPGVLAGMGAYVLIYRLYCMEYSMTWRFPWDGLLLGLSILLAANILSNLLPCRPLRRKLPFSIINPSL